MDSNLWNETTCVRHPSILISTVLEDVQKEKNVADKADKIPF